MKPFEIKLKSDYIKTKEFLAKNKQLIFTNSDKGNVTVRMYSNDYLIKLYELLNDKAIYERCNIDPKKLLDELHSEFYAILLN